MVEKLEIILMRHNESYDNRAKVIQGQRDTPPVDGNEDRLYNAARLLVGERTLIDAIYTSDAKRAKNHARLIADFLRPHYSEMRQAHTVDYFENELLRERARGPLEGARYFVDDGGLNIVLEEGKTILLPGGQTTQTLKLPQFRNVDDYLWSLDDPELGEDRAAIAERIAMFRERYLRPYGRRGGKVLIMGHSHWINHARNLLVDDDVASRPFEPIGNLESIRLFKPSPRSHYIYRNGSCVPYPQPNTVGTK